MIFCNAIKIFPYSHFKNCNLVNLFQEKGSSIKISSFASEKSNEGESSNEGFSLKISSIASAANDDENSIKDTSAATKETDTASGTDDTDDNIGIIKISSIATTNEESLQDSTDTADKETDDNSGT